mmetsp:Transcript_104585/g.196918  ORF Transcript_104585/g.196918 Transcript_104585/m.196918 type:complete len:365 (+) Transcript_104585:34-1128(+)
MVFVSASSQHMASPMLALVSRLLLSLAAPLIFPAVGLRATFTHGGIASTASDLPLEHLSLLQVQVRKQAQSTRSTQFPVQRVPPKALWIKSMPRSGSSLLLTLVQQVEFPVFALFEPCSPKDNLEPWLAKQGCGALLSRISQCNFEGVNWLDGWFNTHSNLNGAHYYSVQSATQACQSASLVVFKTITWGHSLTSEAIPFLEANPHVQAIDVVRDPRSIYASMSRTSGFIDNPLNNSDLLNWCNIMNDNLNTSHPRMMQVVYEDLVKAPSETAMTIFDFLQAPEEANKVLANVSSYVTASFNSTDAGCDDGNFFVECRSNSTEPLDRFTILPIESFDAFVDSVPCRTVAHHFHYNLWHPFDWWN